MIGRHICNNPPCCNPEHLEWGSASDNMKDRVASGRHCGGTKGNQVRIASSVPEELHHQLERIAEIEELSLSIIVKRACRLYVASSTNALVDTSEARTDSQRDARKGKT